MTQQNLPFCIAALKMPDGHKLYKLIINYEILHHQGSMNFHHVKTLHIYSRQSNSEFRQKLVSLYPKLGSSKVEFRLHQEGPKSTHLGWL
jgi:hypothetical protein